MRVNQDFAVNGKTDTAQKINLNSFQNEGVIQRELTIDQPIDPSLTITNSTI